jgi:hypothetical protein
MRHLAATTLLALAPGFAGCQQEFVLQDKIDPPVEEPDTDLGVPLDQPQIKVKPEMLDFGSLPVDCPAEAQTFTIRNTGNAPLDVTAVTLRGQGKAAFTVTFPDPITLAPNEWHRVQVDFMARGYFDYGGAFIEVESSDPDEPVVEVDVAGSGAEEATFEESYLQEQAGQVDVMFVVDNSGSMSSNLSALAAAFNAFILQFDQLGLDYHIAVATTDMDATGPGGRGQFVGPVISPTTVDPVAEFTSQTNLGASGSADEQGLAAARAALTPPLITGANSGFIRPDANLSVVVVSDEDDSSPDDTTQWSNWLESYKPSPDQTSLSGLTGPDGGAFNPIGCTSARGDASSAPRYHRAIRRTKGMWSSLCNADMTQFLTYLSYVAAGLLYRFELQGQPANIGSIQVQVDGVDVPFSTLNGWSYEPGENAIQLNGAAIPDPGQVITIRYPGATVCSTAP